MNVRFYNLIRATIGPLYRFAFPSDVFGAENIPAEGGVVVCANHQHFLDCVCLVAHLHKRRYTFLAKAEAMKHPLANLILGDKGMGAIPIKRGEADLTAMRAALKVVADGGALGIFPQGTRSRDNTPTPMLNGVSMIAMRAGAPIIPVYISGPYRFFRRTEVHVGKPVDISDLGRKYDSATLTEVTHRIENAVWGMRKK